jgi:hypothetical protein
MKEGRKERKKETFRHHIPLAVEKMSFNETETS